MSAPIIWLIIAGVLVICELLTGTFYLLMIAVGMLAGAIFAAFGLDQTWQITSAAAVSACATLALHNSRFGWRRGKNANRDPNILLDIGQTLTVSEWTLAHPGRYHARTMYRGAMWNVECHQDQVKEGLFTIVEVHGNHLIVKPS